MAKEEHGTLRVVVTSVDGNLSHPFKRTDSVGDVQAFAYPKLVKDKTAVPFSSTWIEFNGKQVASTEQLGVLAGPEGSHGHGNEPDLTLTLAWGTQGGTEEKHTPANS